MKPSRTQQIVGWVLSILVCLFLIVVSGVPKFIDFPGKAEMFDKMGVTNDLIMKIGVMEIAIALLLVIPRASFMGAILLAGYLGGAIMTHLRIGDPFYFPIIIGVLAWLGVAFRQPEIFALALGRQVPLDGTLAPGATAHGGQLK